MPGHCGSRTTTSPWMCAMATMCDLNVEDAIMWWMGMVPL